MTALNFDPYAALAEIEDRTGLGDNWANRANLPSASTLAPLARLALSLDPERTSEPSSDWQGRLAQLDAAIPPKGFTLRRWQQLVEDSRWFTLQHGNAVAQLGWIASDLFGIADLPGWGGLADRLDGARRVTFSETVVHWRTDELDGWLWRLSLRPMMTIWEVAAMPSVRALHSGAARESTVL